MSHCSCYYSESKCPNEAVYLQNEYTPLCADCFGEITNNMFKTWHEWFLSNRTTHEPVIWLYNSEKNIRG